MNKIVTKINDDRDGLTGIGGRDLRLFKVLLSLCEQIFIVSTNMM